MDYTNKPRLDETATPEDYRADVLEIIQGINLEDAAMRRLIYGLYDYVRYAATLSVGGKVTLESFYRALIVDTMFGVETGIRPSGIDRLRAIYDLLK